jgi:hypothetical protein
MYVSYRPFAVWASYQSLAIASGQTNSTYFKFSGATTDSCESEFCLINIMALPSANDSFLREAWAIFPFPPFHNSTGGNVSVLSATTTESTAYSLCGTTALAGVSPTSESWSTPTAASQATIIPALIKTDFGTESGYLATKGGGKVARTYTLTTPVARTTGVPALSVSADPRRRQLIGV